VAGADHNHFLPAEAATCAVGATLLGAIFKRLALHRYPTQIVTWVVLGLLIAQLAIFAVPSDRYEIEFRMYKSDEQQQLSQIIKLTAANPQALLTSEAGFFPLTAKDPNYDDLFTLTALTQKGTYDQSGLLERVRHKEFGVVLAPPGDLFDDKVRSDLWTPELLAALKDGYKLLYRDVWFVYVPKS
jgi:hypothetical protein